MGLIRPATPGFLVTLAATVILAVVVFSVPYFKSIYFLKASLSNSGVDGYVTFGVLGYCLDVAGNSTCSKPSIGYELDVNKLLGNDLPVEIPTVVVKWITYALVLHVVALCLAAVSALFGLLAHVREMSMSCFSTCISGFGATIALLAFIFDLVLFFVAKARINKVEGGSATIGTGIWLTLAAWLLLFFSGCFYGLGRCCVRRRPKRSADWENNDKPWSPPKDQRDAQEEQHRLAAVKAEADRKALQGRVEGGLPAFHEYTPVERQEMVPLTGRVEGDSVYVDDDDAKQPYRDTSPTRPGGGQQFAGGYAPAPAGGRTVDDYNKPPRRQGSTGTTATTYPPQPQRQGSGHTQGASAYSQAGHAAAAAATGAAAGAVAAQYLSAPVQQPQPTGAAYGHGQGPSDYHSAAAHQQGPSGYAQFDPYAQPQPPYYAEPTAFNAGTYNNTAAMTGAPYAPYGQQPPAAAPNAPANPYYAPPSDPNAFYGAAAAAPRMPTPGASVAPPERSYTLGGNGYGDNVVPPLAAPPEPQYTGYAGYGASSSHTTAAERPPEYDGPVGGAALGLGDQKRG